MIIVFGIFFVRSMSPFIDFQYHYRHLDLLNHLKKCMVSLIMSIRIYTLFSLELIIIVYYMYFESKSLTGYSIFKSSITFDLQVYNKSILTRNFIKFVDLFFQSKTISAQLIHSYN